MPTVSGSGYVDWRLYAGDVRRVGAAAAGDCLGPGKSMERVERMVRAVHRALDKAIASTIVSMPKDTTIECGPGCSHCCLTLRVAVSPPEALVIADRLAGSTEERDRERVERIAQSAQQAGEVDLPGWSLRKIPCPLLESGLCSLYSIRPISCRGCASADVEKCVARSKDPSQLVPQIVPHLLGGRSMLAGLDEGLGRVGLHGAPVELISAVDLALSDQSAAARWLRGEDVFGHLAALLAPVEGAARC
jgi:Fe-S-cluster containining protein